MTDKIDQHPHCVLLLDEIEKAHPDIYNILLQVMDYGKLTDNNGKSVDFRNVILIMTTNAGAAEMAKSPVGFEREIRVDEDMEAITKDVYTGIQEPPGCHRAVPESQTRNG
jgi:ATP-dependent Clp protease ATP-binding subunit ClpA